MDEPSMPATTWPAQLRSLTAGDLPEVSLRWWQAHGESRGSIAGNLSGGSGILSNPVSSRQLATNPGYYY
uniref:Uncharacterized protein n=1 Tax=Leersia perrieri TaxID=77586 RepID=A0A0D9W3Y0_9ORYZ